jgi:hypothetical protein
MKRLLFCVVGLVLLTACGGGSSDPNTNPDPNNPPSGETYKNYGYVTLTESVTLGSTVPVPTARLGLGAFSELPEAISFPETPTAPTVDTCVVAKNQPNPPTTPSNPEPPTQPVRSLDAGNPLAIRTGTSTYAALNRQIDPQTQTIFYSSDTNASTTLPAFPASATLDIPGANNGFPSFNAVAFPTIPGEFEFSTSEGDLEAVTKDTTFAWTGQGSSTGSFVFFGSQVIDASNFVYFSCTVKDDGSFTFPDTTKAELDAAGFTIGSVSGASRLSARIEAQGDAILYLTVIRSQTFIPSSQP